MCAPSKPCFGRASSFCPTVTTSCRSLFSRPCAPLDVQSVETRGAASTAFASISSGEFAFAGRMVMCTTSPSWTTIAEESLAKAKELQAIVPLDQAGYSARLRAASQSERNPTPPFQLGATRTSSSRAFVVRSRLPSRLLNPATWSASQPPPSRDRGAPSRRRGRDTCRRPSRCC